MTRLVNDPSDFPAEAVAGFADAYSQYVKPLFGGVVRSTRTPQGKVALVVGGGSGHYPAFAGWVGPGFLIGEEKELILWRADRLRQLRR